MIRKQNGNESKRIGFNRRTILKSIGATGIGTAVLGGTSAATPPGGGNKGCDLLVNPNSNSPQHYNTIQAAVDDAVSGDTICVTPGTYDEQVVIGTNGLTLRGPGHPKNVVVDGGSGIRETVDVNGASDLTIDGFTVKNTGGSGSSL